MASQKAKKKKLKKKKPIKVKKVPFWKNSDLLLPIAIILLGTLFAFWPSLANDFVNWDDDVNILENPNLKAFDWPSIKAIFTDKVIGGYNPLAIFTFAIEKHFFGLNPKVFHLNNILLHLVCVFMVYRLSLELKLSKAAVIILTVLFAIHPLRVESIAWATERKDVLFGAFYISALYTYVKYLNSSLKVKKYFWWTFALFIFALFSKIQAVSLPLSLLCLDYYFNRKLGLKLIFEKIPFFLGSLLFGLMGIFFLSEANTLDDTTDYSFFERLLVGAYSYCVYLMKWIFPYEMSPLYPYPKNLDWKFYIAPIGFFGSIAAMYYAFEKGKKALVFGFVFFFVNIVFMLQILGAGQGFKADRFTYIAYLGLFFMMAYGYDQFVKQKPQLKNIILGVVAAYLLVFTYLTHQQTKVWKNGETLWSHVLKHYDNISTPYGNRGQYRRDNGDTAGALEDYSKAISLTPKKANLYNSRGRTYFESEQNDLAIQDYTMGIEQDPDLAELYVNRGAAYAKAGNYNQALKDLNKGEELEPEFTNTYLNRSLVYSVTGEYQLALEDHNKYLKYDPYNADIWYERAIVKRRLGMDNVAMPDFNQAIKMNPGQGIYYLGRSRLFSAQGNSGAAMQDALQAQRLGRPEAADLIKELQGQ